MATALKFGLLGNNTKAVSLRRNCFFRGVILLRAIFERINEFLWGIPTLIGIITAGLYITFQNGCVQLRLFPRALRCFIRSFCGDSDKNKESSFQALCTALAATVGTGNIAGVAGAIAIGGPGSIFWMWVFAFLGMGVKFAEATLSVQYRKLDSNGNILGGPMYMIELGMGRRWRWLAGSYCFFGTVAAFGVGNATQINAVIDAGKQIMNCFEANDDLAVCISIGILFSVLITVSLLGGMKRVGKIASLLVPVASCAYILLGIGALIAHRQQILPAFQKIILGAFSPGAITGGTIGSIFTALRVGASRGTFTNEAGMGTAAIAHGTSSVSHPVEQGLMGIIEVFLDTIVICTITGLVILTSGISIPYGIDEGAVLTTRAFACTYGQWVSVPMAVFLSCFAFATMIGWGFYGLRCVQYLLGEGAWKPFVFLQAVICTGSVLLETGTVWLLAEMMNGLMVIPNLVCLGALTPELLKLVKTYKKEERL